MSKTPIEFQIYDWMEDHEEGDCSIQLKKVIIKYILFTLSDELKMENQFI